jgi:hypothetical protein
MSQKYGFPAQGHAEARHRPFDEEPCIAGEPSSVRTFFPFRGNFCGFIVLGETRADFFSFSEASRHRAPP